MSIASITTFGFGSFSTINLAVILGYGGQAPVPPATATLVPGVADSERDRRDYLNEMSMRLLLMDD